jgi:integrase
MSVQFDSSRNRWVVRWSEAGRQRARRFAQEGAARGFDRERRGARLAAREAHAAGLAAELARLRARVETIENELPADAQATGVYSYATKQGVRWRIAVKQSDGTVTTHRGYRTHAAACRARDRATHTETPGAEASFGCFWRRWLAEKQPYLTEGSLEDLETHGRKRLLPHLAHVPVGAISEQHVRDWMARMTEQQRSGALSAKTINNARAALSGALADASRRDLLPRNPCEFVAPLPLEHRELDYLRLAEIDRYLDACTAHYRPLAELLIGTGARISEALALTWPDLNLDQGTVHIHRQQPRGGEGIRPPKGKRSRTVLIGPRLIDALNAHRDTAHGRRPWLFVCPQPTRGRYAQRPATDPPSRRTVHEWHRHALTAARLRDMPLHALRHTAAASWLTTGHNLIFVARQLGHRSITTTEQHYGHLELNLFTTALTTTDEARTVRESVAVGTKRLSRRRTLMTEESSSSPKPASRPAR